MNKILIVSLLIGLFLIGSVSAYYCFSEKDTISMQEFKSKINKVTINHELSHGVTPEAIKLKHQYFGGCS